MENGTKMCWIPGDGQSDTQPQHHFPPHSGIFRNPKIRLAFMFCIVTGLPVALKSCFWPLIGDKIFTWVGDIVDILSIFTTLFGVCTALGLGARQINQGNNGEREMGEDGVENI